MNEFYRVSNPNEVEPTPETFLFKEIKRGLFVAQGSNGREWGYGLVVHSDKYYLFNVQSGRTELYKPIGT